MKTNSKVVANGTAERRKHELEVLRQSQAFLSALVESTRDMVWSVDAKTFRLLTFNSALRDYLKHTYSVDVREGMLLEDVLPPDRSPVWYGFYNRVLTQGPFRIEYELFAGQGYLALAFNRIIKDGEILGISIFGKDITERKRAEHELLKQKEFSDQVINSLPGIFYLFDATGRMLLWNKNLESVTEQSAEETARNSPLDNLPDEEKALVAARIREAFESGSADAEVNVISTKSGKRTPFYVTGSRIFLDGKPCLVGMGIDITRRKEAEQRLDHSHEQLRALAARLQKVREAERTRIAREIHDVLGQSLTGLKIDLAWLAKKIGDEQLDLLEKIHAMTELVDPTIRLVRKICTELRPGVLDDLGLLAAIEWQAEEFTARTGIETNVSAGADAIKLDGERSTAVFRIFQEALTNVARHSGAARVQIELRGGESGVELIVRDDGRGFTAADFARTESLGILGMRERAYVFGGAVRISGVQGEGTTLHVTVPLKSPARKKSR